MSAQQGEACPLGRKTDQPRPSGDQYQRGQSRAQPQRLHHADGVDNQYGDGRAGLHEESDRHHQKRGRGRVAPGGCLRQRSRCKAPARLAGGGQTPGGVAERVRISLARTPADVTAGRPTQANTRRHARREQAAAAVQCPYFPLAIRLLEDFLRAMWRTPGGARFSHAGCDVGLLRLRDERAQQHRHQLLQGHPSFLAGHSSATSPPSARWAGSYSSS